MLVESHAELSGVSGVLVGPHGVLQGVSGVLVDLSEGNEQNGLCSEGFKSQEVESQAG